MGARESRFHLQLFFLWRARLQGHDNRLHIVGYAEGSEIIGEDQHPRRPENIHRHNEDRTETHRGLKMKL